MNHELPRNSISGVIWMPKGCSNALQGVVFQQAGGVLTGTQAQLRP